jgi:hypothetical protein
VPSLYQPPLRTLLTHGISDSVRLIAADIEEGERVGWQPCV